MNTRKVTVGIPVYNEEKTIRKTLDSVIDNLDYIAQIIISDNASTDKTSEICQEFAEKYLEIKYVKQDAIGTLGNLYEVINMAKTEYYIHIGGHDIFPINYVKNLFEVISSDKNIINVFTNAIDKKTRKLGSPKLIKRHLDLQSESYFIRVMAYIENIQCNLLFYGINRTETIQKAVNKYRNRYYGMGADLLINIDMLCKGKSIYINAEPIEIVWDIHLSKEKAIKRYTNRNIKIDAKHPYREMCHEILKILQNKGMKEKSYQIKTIKELLKIKFQFKESYLELVKEKIFLNI